MKYETPELTALTPAVNAIQTTKAATPTDDSSSKHEIGMAAYEDWEE
jgi:hypothetical protein